MAERDRKLGHAREADGIDEYDNDLPAWWVGLFCVTVVFGVVYALDYHFVSRRSLAAVYEAEVAAFAEAHPPAVAASGDLSSGESVFQANCVGCHGAAAKGGVGPDLTDSTWIHGGTLADIERTVTVGVPEKGMLTWGPILGPQKVADVARWIHSRGGGQ